jgi:hypothetical protein
VSQRCWATEKIGFIVYTTDPITLQYLGAVEGLNATDKEDVAQIQELIAQTLYEMDTGLIMEISASNPALSKLEVHQQAAEVIQTLRINMINIRAQGGSLRPIANMYIDCPCELDEDWSRLVDAVAQTKFKHSLLGTGTIHRGWTCTICHGVDHPSGLCPFPMVPGWISAKPIAPIADHRNRSSRQSQDNTESCRGRGGYNRPDRGGPMWGRGKANRSRGA